MNEDYVSFELAKKLKEKGFLYATETIYFEDGGTGIYVGKENIIGSSLFPRPTIALAMKWLREEKKIYVQIEINGKGYVCGLYGRKYDDSYLIVESQNIFKSYEEAAIAGITYVIDIYV